MTRDENGLPHPEPARWYVIEAYDGEDEQAYLRLAAAFSGTPVHVWRPVDVTRATVRGSKIGAPKRMERRRARFGRFIFARCKMSPALFHAITSTTNVRRLLTYAGSFEPAAVPDSLVDFWRSDIPTKPKGLPDGFAKGATVRVEAGPFIGFEGPVTGIDERGTVLVELQVFGRPTPIPLEVGHVSVVAQAKLPPISRAVTKGAHRRAPSAKLAKSDAA